MSMIATRDNWVQQNLLKETGSAAFSFTYRGVASSALLPAWQRQATVSALDANRTQHAITWTDPKTGLTVRCIAVVYQDYPAVEWTTYLKNTGHADTPLLEDVQALDARLPGRPDGLGLLRWFDGSLAIMEDFQPRVGPLSPGIAQHFQPRGGRPSNAIWPYFNLDFGDQGVIVAVGWPGQWAARIAGTAGGGEFRAGQATTHLVLHPGEEIRTPLMALVFWQGGDWIDGQNVWRRWMLAHNVPRLNGELPEPFTAVCQDDGFPGMQSNAADIMAFMDVYRQNGLNYDYWWTDAGWYPCYPDWTNTGTWQPDPKRYPKGLKEITDHAHALGMKHVVWFEPERVTPKTWLYENRPQWLLGPQGGWRLFNMGDPEAWTWLVETVDGLINSQGIDLYRQDFNFEPLPHWAWADTPDRVGMTENKYVVGHLAYWDELRRRHPGMLIDSCASGGRRLDLESMRRAVANTRTDYRFEPIGTQGQHYGISFWIPFTGSGVYQDTKYVMRCHMNQNYGYGVNFRAQLPDYVLLRRLDAEWRKIAADGFLGDFFPLTPYSLAKDVWCVWQYNRPETGTGYLQAFRRQEAAVETLCLKLRGLDRAASYRLTDQDGRFDIVRTGAEVMEKGLDVRLAERPDSATIVYARM